jgi:hypothetical protein
MTEHMKPDLNKTEQPNQVSSNELLDDLWFINNSIWMLEGISNKYIDLTEHISRLIDVKNRLTQIRSNAKDKACHE